MTPEHRIARALFLLRISIAAFFLIWSIEKIVAPELAARVFSTFYFTDLQAEISIFLGILQTAIVLAFLVGFLKTFTYGSLLLMHTVSVASTWERLITPYTPPNHLFWAAVPVLAALVILFLLRDLDTIGTVSRKPRMVPIDG